MPCLIMPMELNWLLVHGPKIWFVDSSTHTLFTRCNQLLHRKWMFFSSFFFNLFSFYYIHIYIVIVGCHGLIEWSSCEHMWHTHTHTQFIYHFLSTCIFCQFHWRIRLVRIRSFAWFHAKNMHSRKTFPSNRMHYFAWVQGKFISLKWIEKWVIKMICNHSDNMKSQRFELWFDSSPHFASTNVHILWIRYLFC